MDSILDFEVDIGCSGVEYSMITMIDYGSFGDVFKVKNNHNQRIRALKEIRFRSDFRDDPYIISELYCLTHLTHKNIIKLYEIIIGEGEIDIIMEYAENENLERFLTLNDNLELHRKYKIYSQILEGVKYCHSRDVAHRDLTPSNILLTTDFVVKIADFGLAVRCFNKADEPILCTDYLGRASYLAPEVIEQKPFLPKPADIWSLGITLLYLLFKATPYSGFESEILHSQLKHSWKEFFTSKSDENDLTCADCLFDFVENMLRLEPSKRNNICELVRLWDETATKIIVESEKSPL